VQSRIVSEPNETLQKPRSVFFLSARNERIVIALTLGLSSNAGLSRRRG
jgi:hypothetical protein